METSKKSFLFLWVILATIFTNRPVKGDLVKNMEECMTIIIELDAYKRRGFYPRLMADTICGLYDVLDKMEDLWKTLPGAPPQILRFNVWNATNVNEIHDMKEITTRLQGFLFDYESTLRELRDKYVLSHDHRCLTTGIYANLTASLKNIAKEHLHIPEFRKFGLKLRQRRLNLPADCIN